MVTIASRLNAQSTIYPNVKKEDVNAMCAISLTVPTRFSYEADSFLNIKEEIPEPLIYYVDYIIEVGEDKNIKRVYKTNTNKIELVYSKEKGD